MSSIPFFVFSALNVMVLKEVNSIVSDPYMDEPFHIPQGQAYCRGDWDVWDPKITTPPGLYITTSLLKSIFMLRCTTSVLRLTSTLFLLVLPLVSTRLLSFHQRVHPPRGLLSTTMESLVLSFFPIAWFFGFLYYTEVGSLIFVLATFVAAANQRHSFAAFLGLISCTFRQTNIIWVIYSFAFNQLVLLRFRRDPPGTLPLPKLHDPPALHAGPGDLIKALQSLPGIIPSLFHDFIPYIGVIGAFIAFVIWNGGIVLGDKSNHIPSVHIPQVYYFIGFASIFGWPALISGEGGPRKLLRDVGQRMYGDERQLVKSIVLTSLIALSIHFFTIHHPFLLSDNRHYTFYVWKRVFMIHPIAPYLFAPAYLACAWAWFIRVGEQQSFLQTILLPLAILPTLLPTPLLEPRYFLIPYFFLRAQVVDMPSWAVVLEGIWYTLFNVFTMFMFLYQEREGVGRFMW